MTEQKGYEPGHRRAAVCSSPPSVQSTTEQAPTDWSPEFCHQQYTDIVSILQLPNRLQFCHVTWWRVERWTCDQQVVGSIPILEAKAA